MKALIIYDSVFGNTQKIANAIEAGISADCEVVSSSIENATIDQLMGIDLLVIGSPTRGFRPTEPMKGFLAKISTELIAEIQVATFDTRIDLLTIKSGFLRFVVNKGGYAADGMAKQFKKMGAKSVLAAEGFLVTGEEGPLKEGELERAEKWGLQLAQPIHQFS
jgi:flavodoxin